MFYVANLCTLSSKTMRKSCFKVITLLLREEWSFSAFASDCKNTLWHDFIDKASLKWKLMVIGVAFLHLFTSQWSV